MLTEQELKPTAAGPATVAVVMPTFNRAHLISESIDSLLNQSRPPDEFIVVDDGSTDGTAEVIRGYGRRIKYLKKANGGKPAAFNLALPHIESTYTLVFDDDDIALPNALEAHLDLLAANPKCDFTYSPHYTFSGDFSEDILKNSKIKEFPYVADGEYFFWTMESAFLANMMQGMLIPTRCFRDVGGFDEEILRGHDWDIMLRIARRFRAARLDQPTFALRAHDGERGPATQRHAETDRFRIWRQYELLTFKKLRDSVDLSDFLNTNEDLPLENRPLTSVEMSQALLQRAKVMAIHGLYHEAIDDFVEYVNQPASVPRLSDTERDQMSAMAYVQNPENAPPPSYYRRLGEVSRGRPELLGATMRGLYWSITREVRRRRAVLVARLLGFAVTLVAGYVFPSAERRHGRGVQ